MTIETYQLHFLLREISPAIWRQVLVRSDSTIADLHYTIQLVMGWSDTHLNRFSIHGKSYGVPQIGGLSFSERAEDVRLCSLGLRRRERFLYEYDFTDGWRLDIRLEQRRSFDPAAEYPKCLGGGRACPPEDCGSPWGYMALEDENGLGAIMDRLQGLCDGDESADEGRADVEEMRYWLTREQFDIRAANQRLARFRAGDNPLDYADLEIQ